MTAPVAEAERESPPGSLTPQVRRQLRESHPVPRIPGVPSAPSGERPYSDIPARQVAAYRLAFAPQRPAPGPSYDPAPGAAPVTAPMAVLPVNAMTAPPPPGRRIPAESADTPDLTLLRRVRDGLEQKWRTESFVADRKELPFFAALTKELGWQGLHMPQRSVTWQRWSTGPWAARERELADAAYTAARAQALRELNDIRTQIHRAPRGAA